MATNNKMPAMYDLDSYIQAGINPQTGLPIKAGDNQITPISKSDIKKQLRILDEQDAVNRFAWYNLPPGLNSRLMERILYYKGQGMFFKINDMFYFLPYALDGSIDVYGRFTEVTPLPFNGSTKNKDGEELPWIPGLKRKVAYDIKLSDEDSDIDNICVLIKDYTEQISQTNISRQILQDPILDIMADMFPFMRTALLNSTGVQGMRVTDQSEYANVEAASRSVNKAALNGQKYIPVVGNVDFQTLTDGNVGKAEEFLLAMQSLDNYRLSLYGLDNGGLFQKKSHMLEAEQSMNSSNKGLVLQDSLKYRQDACNIINSYFDLQIWCDLDESLKNEFSEDVNNNYSESNEDTASQEETTKKEEEDID